MTHGQNDRFKILITDAEFADTVPAIAGDFPNLDLIAATAERDPQSLAANDIAGLITQSVPVDSRLLEAFPETQGRIKAGA